MFKTVYKEVEVDVDLDDFDDDDLIEEIERRGLEMNTKGLGGDAIRELMEKVWDKRRRGVDYQTELDNLIWYSIGRM